MRSQKTAVFFLGILFICLGCEKYHGQEKFERPGWLPGKLYTTVATQHNLTLFSSCLQLTGLDSILDVSGSWSIFAPTDEAVRQYLSENQYSSINEIPLEELNRIVEFHIIQNPWSLDQLKNLSAVGWRTRNDSNPYSYAYKRQTILKNHNEKYWIRKKKDREMIVLDSINSDRYKRVYVPVRKNVPIFYDAYMNVNGITSDDFSFYFDRPFENGNVYFAGSKIIQPDIFAENGFVHIIDKVVDPMCNAEEFLESESPGESYRLFLELVYWYYPSFKANITATYNQPSARSGGLVDTLWDLNYLRLPFALHQENTGNEGPNLNESWIRHNGIIAPEDNAFGSFIDNILTKKSGFYHWPDIYSLPWDIVEILVSPHFKSGPVYPSTKFYSDIFKGKGRFKQNEASVIRKEFGSNCTFIGLDSYIPDRVFTSVTGPVFCRPDFSIFRLAMIYSGTHNIISNYEGELYFFPIPDYALRSDSSLLLNWIDRDEYRYNFQVYNRRKHQVENINQTALRNRILNQVGTSMPNGSAEKEFIRTLGGGYITWDHTGNTIRGTLPCTFGFNSDSVVTCQPALLEEPADNGRTWSVRYWFNFGSSSIQATLADYPQFYSLLKKAGFVETASSDITFMNENEDYTIFIPSEKALARYQAENLNIPDLQRFLKHHFLQGELIFTDNKYPSGSYPTAGGSSLDIQTGRDIIRIRGNNGISFITVSESEASANIMVSKDSKVSVVVHEIDEVLTGY